MPAGPDRGRGWDIVSGDALHELARDRDADVRFSAETELNRRGETRAAPVEEARQRSLF